MVGKAQPPENKIAVVTVHGTGDTAEGTNGEKWFQNGGLFTQRLKERLSAQGIDADIHPHLWSGANSAQGREHGARKLSDLVKKLSKEYSGVHLIGHSHGGNVANLAASMLGWQVRPKQKQKIASLTTVGTPFFKAQLGTAEAFGGLAFLGLVILSILALSFGGLIATFWTPTLHGNEARYATEFVAAATRDGGPPPTQAEIAEHVRTSMEDAKNLGDFARALVWIVLIGASALFFIVPLAVQGMLRILRVLRRKLGHATVFSIWHENDEAISFLKRVEALPLQPFPRGALWRSSRTTGIVWGVRSVIVAFFFSIVVLLAGVFGLSSETAFAWVQQHTGADLVPVFGNEPLSTVGIFLLITTLLCAPLIFGTFYVLTRIIRGLAFETLGRGWLNTTVSAALRGMAFGRDGDERIGQVSTESHTFGSRTYVVDGDLAARMKAGADKSATALIEKYRWTLFSVGADNNDSVGQLAKDAMTFDSLIHTTYFDQPEIAAVIGDYIAENVDRAKG